MKMILSIAIALFLCGCPEVETTGKDSAIEMIKSELLSGSTVTVWPEDDGGMQDIQINGLIVAKSRLGLTLGCFGIPDCVSTNDKQRAIISIIPDDFNMYDDVEFYGTATTYFLTRSHYPYWVGNGNAISFRNIVDNHDGEKYHEKRQGCCANNPEKCHCDPEI